MRTLSLLSLLLWVSATARCQAPSNEIAPEDAAFNNAYPGRSIPKVSGKLLNLSAREIDSLVITYTIVTPFGQFQQQRTTSPRADGSFTVTLDYAFPYQQIWFAVGDAFYAGLYANSDLYLELDMQKLKAVKDGVFMNGDGVRYLGTDGPMNLYLNNYVLFKRAEQLELSGKINELIPSRAPVDSLLPVYNQLFDSLGIIQAQYIAANPSPYSWILDNERMSDYYAALCVKYAGKVMKNDLWQQLKLHKTYLVSNSSASFYLYLTNYYVHYLPAERGSRPSVAKTIQRLDSLFPPAKADYLKFRLSKSLDVKDQTVATDSALASMRTYWCISVEKKELERSTAKLNEISQALARPKGEARQSSFGKSMIETDFGASLYIAGTVKAADFLTKLKQSYPGKAIIIDRWATWCLPCLGEMPHSKELQESSKDLPVVFVYLCTLNNSSESKWKSKVMELKQPGVHILIDETLDADISNYFSFNGYPGHALIDKTGQYKPGAIESMSQIQNREALATLIGN